MRNGKEFRVEPNSELVEKAKALCNRSIPTAYKDKIAFADELKALSDEIIGYLHTFFEEAEEYCLKKSTENIFFEGKVTIIEDADLSNALNRLFAYYSKVSSELN